MTDGCFSVGNFKRLTGRTAPPVLFLISDDEGAGATVFFFNACLPLLVIKTTPWLILNKNSRFTVACGLIDTSLLVCLTLFLTLCPVLISLHAIELRKREAERWRLFNRIVLPFVCSSALSMNT